ncbi:MAG: hypothetical protein ACKPKO_34005, partial [Candidatus Fonsibacter sp.]
MGKTSTFGDEASAQMAAQGFFNQAAQDGAAPGGDAVGTDDPVKAENRGTSGAEASDIIGCSKAAYHDMPLFESLSRAEFQDMLGTGSAVGQ